MRRMIPVAIVLMVAAPMAGCITAQATAMQYRDAAHARANEWDSGAELAQIVGVEGQFESAMSSGSFGGSSGSGSYGGYGDYGGSGDTRVRSSHGDAPYWDRAKDDPRVGDGRAEFWVYSFVAEGRDETFIVVVDQDGQVIDNGTEAKEDDVPIGTWNVDSDRALQIAKDNNEGIRRGTDSDNFGLVMVLDRDPDQDNARWTVVGGGGDASGGGGGVVIIDAVTGEVLSSQGGFSGS